MSNSPKWMVELSDYSFHSYTGSNTNTTNSDKPKGPPGGVFFSLKHKETLNPLPGQEVQTMKKLIFQEMQVMQDIMDSLAESGVTEKNVKAVRTYLKLREEVVDVLVGVVERLVQAEAVQTAAVTERTKASLYKSLEVANG